MNQIRLEDVRLTLLEENDGVRVKSETENIILPDQTLENVSNIVYDNFVVIKSFYEERIPVHLRYNFNLFDIQQVSVSILLHYLYMYNSWRRMYKKNANMDLRFNPKDFDNPSTHDIIFNYIKGKYPNEWEEKCSILLGMSVEQLRTYYATRVLFYNR